MNSIVKIPVSEEEKNGVCIEKIEKKVHPKEELKSQTSESSIDLAEEKTDDSIKTIRKSPVKKNRKVKMENTELSMYFIRNRKILH